MNKQKSMVVIMALACGNILCDKYPFSKVLNTPTFMASFLYMGAGIGVGIRICLIQKREKNIEKLSKTDSSYTLG